MTFLDAALEYHRQGLHPIPVEPRGKRPLFGWAGFQRVQPSIAQLVQWWTDRPDANVALVLGRGIFAVDIDGPEGQEALDRAGVVFDAQSPVSLTAKGRHVFLKGEVPDRVGLLPKVDIRGIGYVVAPPSVHATGKVYEWLVPWRGLELVPTPPALTALLAAKGGESAPGSSAQGSFWLTGMLGGVAEGSRDNACTRLAGYFLGKGVPVEAVEALLETWADRCTPPFPSDQVAKCVASVAKREGEPPEDVEDNLLSVADLYSMVPDKHAWVWQDYLPEGALVMLAAEEKAGKSTLVYALLAAIVRGQKFLNRVTVPSPILMLAVEEADVDVKMRSLRFGIEPGAPITYYIGDLPATEKAYAQVRETVMKRGIRLVVLDTMAYHLAGVLDSENENTAAIKALRPWLKLARETRACVLLVHHTTKGGWSYRGATAFGGIVDQILTLRYYGGGNQRALSAKGRYRETPAEIQLALYGDVYMEV